MNRTWTKKTMQAVRQALSWLRSQTETEVCILCDSAGNVIERDGHGAWNSDLVTALAAGVYGASRELARILGQDEFDSVLNQGENTNIFFQSVTEDLLLVSVFSETASAGLVKVYAGRTAESLRHTLADLPLEQMSEDKLPLLLLNNEDTLFSANLQEDYDTMPQRKQRVAGQI